MLNPSTYGHLWQKKYAIVFQVPPQLWTPNLTIIITQGHYLHSSLAAILAVFQNSEYGHYTKELTGETILISTLVGLDEDIPATMFHDM